MSHRHRGEFRRLAAHPGVPRIGRGDPRFVRIIGEPTRRALIAAHLGRDLSRHLDYQAMLPAATAAVLLLDRIAIEPLEAQVTGLVRGVLPPGSDTQLRRVLEATGWAGGRPGSTAAVAAEHGVGRQAVAHARRQVYQRLPTRPWLPALDAAGALLSCLAPLPAEQVARRLRDAQITDRLYTADAVLDLAHRLRLNLPLELVQTEAGPLIASRRDAARLRRTASAAQPIRAAVLAALRRRRVARIDELTAQPELARRPRGHSTDALATLEHIVGLPDGWIGSVAPGASQFDATLRVMFAVNHTLPLAALSDGLRRGMVARGLLWPVPDHVLLAYLRHRDDLTVDGEVIVCRQPVAVDVIPPGERDLLTAIRRSPTGTLRYHQAVAAATACGRSAGTARVYLARSPVVQRVGRGIYAARGDTTRQPS